MTHRRATRTTNLLERLFVRNPPVKAAGQAAAGIG
jgi:hypothetical protein